MTNNFIKSISLKKFENNSVFSTIEGLNKFNSLEFEKPITFFPEKTGLGNQHYLKLLQLFGDLIQKAGVKTLISPRITHI